MTWDRRQVVRSAHERWQNPSLPSFLFGIAKLLLGPYPVAMRATTMVFVLLSESISR